MAMKARRGNRGKDRVTEIERPTLVTMEGMFVPAHRKHYDKVASDIAKQRSKRNDVETKLCGSAKVSYLSRLIDEIWELQCRLLKLDHFVWTYQDVRGQKAVLSKEIGELPAKERELMMRQLHTMRDLEKLLVERFDLAAKRELAAQADPFGKYRK